jgi:hypothetical protein
MGWDGPYFVDEMVQVRVIPSFVCFQRFEGRDKICLPYNI